MFSFLLGGVASNPIGTRNFFKMTLWVNSLPLDVKSLSEQNVWWNLMELPFWVHWHIKSRFIDKLGTCKTFLMSIIFPKWTWIETMWVPMVIWIYYQPKT